MVHSVLDKDSIGDLTGATLLISVGKDALGVIIDRPGTEAAPLRAIIPWDSSINDSTHRIEEVIYNNPVLLADFDRVHVLIDTPDFCILPDTLTDDDAYLHDSILPKIIPDSDIRTDWIFTRWTEMKAVCAARESATMLSFLARTFNNPVVEHRLSAWVRRLYRFDPLGMSGKMHVHITASRIDTVVFSRRSIKIVNSWEYRDLADALYFILATRHVLDLDNSTGEVIIAGDKVIVDEILPSLREYVASVMPLHTDNLDSPPLFEESFHELTSLYLCE